MVKMISNKIQLNSKHFSCNYLSLCFRWKKLEHEIVKINKFQFSEQFDQIGERNIEEHLQLLFYI